MERGPATLDIGVVTHQLVAHYYDEGAVMKVTALSVTIVVGMAVFGSSVLVLKAYDTSMITKLLKRKRA